MIVYSLNEEVTDGCTFFCTHVHGLFATPDAATKRLLELVDAEEAEYNMLSIVPITVEI